MGFDMKGARWVGLAVCAFASQVGWAQGLRTLEPSAFWVRGDRFDLRVALDGKADLDSRTQWAFARGGQDQENAASLSALDWNLKEGLSYFGVDLEPVWESALPHQDGTRSDRVRRVQSAAALVRTESTEPVPSAIAVSKAGLAAEIRPLLDPTAPGALLSSKAGPAPNLPVRVYVEGAPVGGVTVEASHADGARTRAQTDREGIAALELDRVGSWTLAFHYYRAADTTLFTGTLRFEVRR